MKSIFKSKNRRLSKISFRIEHLLPISNATAKHYVALRNSHDNRFKKRF